MTVFVEVTYLLLHDLDISVSHFLFLKKQIFFQYLFANLGNFFNNLYKYVQVVAALQMFALKRFMKTVVFDLQVCS